MRALPSPSPSQTANEPLHLSDNSKCAKPTYPKSNVFGYKTAGPVVNRRKKVTRSFLFTA